MGKYFGTDGFRGKSNQDLTVDHAFKIGRYLGFYYGKGSRIVIGKDTRRSSYMFECALTAGITASGADAYLMHVTTTPSVSYITRIDDFDCGIMISASHNPYDDNGIKLMNSQGEKMNDDFVDDIERYLDGDLEGLSDSKGNVLHNLNELPLAKGADIGMAIDYASGRNRYIGYLISLVTHSYKDMRVGLDCANGSAWMIAKSVFDAVGADTYVINNRPNGENINLEAGSTHIEYLQELVKKEKLDVGFAFDGDADRCLVVDENGDVVDGDGILYIYSKYMKRKDTLDKNTTVATIMSNYGFLKAMEEAEINVEITQVGDRFVYEKMRDDGYVLGGEQSGHIIFAKYANTGDGVLTAIKVMQAMLSQKSTLTQLLEGFNKYPQLLKNIVVTDKDETLNDERVKAACKTVKKALGNEGRVLLRKSGTEPVLRVMVEAITDELCHEKVDYIIEEINKAGYLLEIKK
ncbi:MAG: phosphoglucosamine mutase [Christensenellaceae bacterium]|nr:phosphoglucosamine mutase [Christensenellaceae bacterium]